MHSGKCIKTQTLDGSSGHVNTLFPFKWKDKSKVCVGGKVVVCTSNLEDKNTRQSKGKMHAGLKAHNPSMTSAASWLLPCSMVLKLRGVEGIVPPKH